MTYNVWEQQTLLLIFLLAPFHFLPWNEFLKELSLLLALPTCPCQSYFCGIEEPGNLLVCTRLCYLPMTRVAHNTWLGSVFNFICLNPESLARLFPLLISKESRITVI